MVFLSFFFFLTSPDQTAYQYILCGANIGFSVRAISCNSELLMQYKYGNTRDLYTVLYNAVINLRAP